MGPQQVKRKIYETSADVERETMVINDLERAWNPVVISRLPKKYMLDAFADFGTHYAFIEIKVRTVASTDFDTYMIGLRKVLEGVGHCSLIPGGLFLLVVRWTDGLFCVDVGDVLDQCHVTAGGRLDRSDAQDVEPVIHIPVELFQRIDVDKTA